MTRVDHVEPMLRMKHGPFVGAADNNSGYKDVNLVVRPMSVSRLSITVKANEKYLVTAWR